MSRQNRPVVILTLLAAFAMVGYTVSRDRPPEVLPVEALTGFQDADAPLFLPADGQPRHALHRLSAWQLAEIPVAACFSMPLGSRQGALTTSAPEGYDGIGGANTDLGDPVFAIADGLVIGSGGVSPRFGKRIVLAHRDREGRISRSVYSGLDRQDVSPGDLVFRGRLLGTLGTSGGRHPAVLAFGVYAGQGISGGPGEGKASRDLPGSVPGSLAPAPLAAALKSGR